LAVCRIKPIARPAETRGSLDQMTKGPTDQSVHDEHDLRRLRAEIESARRCGGHLDRIGVRLAFRPRAVGKGVEIEVRGRSGEALCSVAPRQLLGLLEGGPGDIEMWLVTTCQEVVAIIDGGV
jgi:hypothetical protein